MTSASAGIGASVPRKEDERFLKGRGQYVADFRVPGMREMAFVRSPLAHARIRAINVPNAVRGQVFIAAHLSGVQPIRAVTALHGFKMSSEPILAVDKVRYVGEIIAICVAPTRAEAEDVAAAVALDLQELPAISDVAAACLPDAALVHEHRGDNVFLEIIEGGEQRFSGAPIKVTIDIRTARHCMFPMEGRGVVAYKDDRLGYLTLVSATQMPHVVQIGVAECLGLEPSAIRVISPDVGGALGTRASSAERRSRPLGWRNIAALRSDGWKIVASI